MTAHNYLTGRESRGGTAGVSYDICCGTLNGVPDWRKGEVLSAIREHGYALPLVMTSSIYQPKGTKQRQEFLWQQNIKPAANGGARSLKNLRGQALFAQEVLERMVNDQEATVYTGMLKGAGDGSRIGDLDVAISIDVYDKRRALSIINTWENTGFNRRSADTEHERVKQRVLSMLREYAMPAQTMPKIYHAAERRRATGKEGFRTGKFFDLRKRREELYAMTATIQKEFPDWARKVLEEKSAKRTEQTAQFAKHIMGIVTEIKGDLTETYAARIIGHYLQAIDPHSQSPFSNVTVMRRHRNGNIHDETGKIDLLVVAGHNTLVDLLQALEEKDTGLIVRVRNERLKRYV